MKTARILTGMFYVVFLLFGITDAYNFCYNGKEEEMCGTDKRHVVCSDENIEKQGTILAQPPITYHVIETFLGYVNRLRNNVSAGFKKDPNPFPTASRMRELIWDNELSYFALSRTNTCSNTRSACSVSPNYKQAGEINGYYGQEDTPIRFDTAFEAVFDSFYHQGDSIEDKATFGVAYDDKMEEVAPDLSVLINDRASRVGCGLTLCRDCTEPKNGSAHAFCYFISCVFDSNVVKDCAVYDTSDIISGNKCEKIYGAYPGKKYEHLCPNDGKRFPQIKCPGEEEDNGDDDPFAPLPTGPGSAFDYPVAPPPPPLIPPSPDGSVVEQPFGAWFQPEPINTVWPEYTQGAVETLRPFQKVPPGWRPLFLPTMPAVVALRPKKGEPIFTMVDIRQWPDTPDKVCAKIRDHPLDKQTLTYCSGVPTKQQLRHIACHFPHYAILGDLAGHEFAKAIDRWYLLFLHNQLRNNVASGKEWSNNITTKQFYPPATRMREVIWDEELEWLAMWSVKHCHYAHDKCRGTVKFGLVGQNIGHLVGSPSGFGKPYFIQKVMMGFYMEKNHVEDTEDFVYNYRPYHNDIRKAGHFAQLLVDKNARIGCGFSKCLNCSQTPANERATHHSNFITCHYSSMNIYDFVLYKTGKPTSECHEYGLGKSKRYKFLCEQSPKLIENEFFNSKYYKSNGKEGNTYKQTDLINILISMNCPDMGFKDCEPFVKPKEWI